MVVLKQASEGKEVASEARVSRTSTWHNENSSDILSAL